MNAPMNPYRPAEVLEDSRAITESNLEDIERLMQNLAGYDPKKQLPATLPMVRRRHYEQILAAGAIWVVIRDERGVIVSMAIATPYLLAEYVGEQFAMLNDVSTLPAHQGRGLARTLMAKLVETWKTRGYKRVNWTSSKLDAQRFYASQAMKDLGIMSRETQNYFWAAENLEESRGQL